MRACGDPNVIRSYFAVQRATARALRLLHQRAWWELVGRRRCWALINRLGQREAQFETRIEVLRITKRER